METDFKSRVRNQILSIFKEARIQVAVKDLDFLVELKFSRSASPTSSLILTLESFTTVFTIVAVEDYPALRKAEVRYHRESSPDRGTWDYLVVDVLELRGTPTESEIELTRTRLSTMLKALLERLAEEVLELERGRSSRG